MEKLIIDFLLNFIRAAELDAFLTNPRHAAVIVGSLVAVSGALLGTFLLLRRMSLTSDAISHTVLLGIVVAFLIMTNVFGQAPNIASPWLIIGAAVAGVATVFLTELIYSSGLVKEDAALGLAFPLLFAISIILIARYTANIHLDQDAVLLGEIGLTWGDTHTYCYENCDDVVITPDHPKAEIKRTCINCRPNGDYNPRDPQAIFEESCGNCGRYSASDAWAKRYITADQRPLNVRWPKAFSVMGLITLINIAFVSLLYKELKLATFDRALAAALGFRPGLLHYLLMLLVSITAVGAFDAVGAILVVAFFIVPPATAYLLTDRLWGMLILSSVIGALGVYTGYDLASGNFLGVLHINDLLQVLDRWIGLEGYTNWNTSISASMVMMTGFYFLVAWVVSPRYGLFMGIVRRLDQRRRFAEQLLLAHLANHPTHIEERRLENLPSHLNWSAVRIQRVVARLRLQNHIRVEERVISLTEHGQQRAREFSMNILR